MAKIFVERTVQYEGDSEWVELVLSKSFQLGKKFTTGNGSIVVRQERRNAVEDDIIELSTDEWLNRRST